MPKNQGFFLKASDGNRTLFHSLSMPINTAFSEISWTFVDNLLYIINYLPGARTNDSIYLKTGVRCLKIDNAVLGY